jgi:hypothetical protein
VAGDRDQLLMMPPSLAEWLPTDHLAWFVLDVVGELDPVGVRGGVSGRMVGVAPRMSRR